MTYSKEIIITTAFTTMAASPVLDAKQVDGTCLCKKTQCCTLSELKSQNLLPNIMQMAKDSVKDMCEQRQDEFAFNEHITSEHKMNLANQCIQSMEKI